MVQVGHVTLVGAGPGDSGLLTVKGRQAILDADVIVYDRLVGAEILALLPQTAEQIDVGKKSSYHPVPQQRINEILLEKAREGKIGNFVSARCHRRDREWLWQDDCDMRNLAGICQSWAGHGGV